MLMDIAELHKGLQEIHDNTFTATTTTTTATTPPSVTACVSSDLPDQTNPNATSDPPSDDATHAPSNPTATDLPISPTPTGPLSPGPRPAVPTRPSPSASGAVISACRECVGKKQLDRETIESIHTSPHQALMKIPYQSYGDLMLYLCKAHTNSTPT